MAIHSVFERADRGERGERSSPGGRCTAFGGHARVVLRMDTPGDIILRASIPQCGNLDGTGGYRGVIARDPLVTITGE
jgi:hypothetical protein